jgi:putative ABC transport system permease protein
MHSGHLRRLSVRILFSLGFRSVIACTVLAAGTAALITNIAITDAARKHSALQFERYGAHYVYVLPVVVRRGPANAPAGGDALSPRQLRAIQSMPNCLWAAIVQRTVPAANGARRAQTAVAGVDAGYFQIRGLEAAEGRLIGDEDSRALARVAVLSSTIARELFPGESPIGKTVRINHVPFTVAGMLVARGTDLQGQDLDNVIFIPRKTAAVRVFGTSQINMIIVRGVANESARSIGARVTEQMQKQHRRGDSSVSVKVPEVVISMSARSEEIYKNWTLGAAIIGMIAGGTGICVIMLITVKDRAAEIALRRALGATRTSILRQFIFETACLVVAGVAVGVIAGLALGIGLSAAVYGIRSFPWTSLAYAAIPAAFGALAGLIPSWAAARLNIIRALAG